MEARWLIALVASSAACHAQPTPLGEIPADPEAGATTTNASSTFAIDQIFLGDTDRTNQASTTAWQGFGYDLDGLHTDATSTDVCSLQPGASLAYQVDGPGGIDNAWGALVLPILETAMSEAHPSNAATLAIGRGDWTLLVQVDGLSDDAQQNADSLDAQVSVGAPTTPPAFDGTTNWPVRPGAPVHFSKVYVVGGTLVARDADAAISIPLEIGIFGSAATLSFVLPLVVHDPIITFAHTSPDAAENGTLAGVLDAEAFIATLQAFAGRISASLCGSAFDGIASQLRACEEILPDGSNDPSAMCSGISLGIGFRATRVANPTTIGDEPPPPPDPCLDGGGAD
ncbi:MAG TPA: hypothetical protein VGH28_05760 [Polyangiaceae bacterium]|jgi:hypothetical protein